MRMRVRMRVRMRARLWICDGGQSSSRIRGDVREPQSPCLRSDSLIFMHCCQHCSFLLLLPTLSHGQGLAPDDRCHIRPFCWRWLRWWQWRWPRQEVEEIVRVPPWAYHTPLRNPRERQGRGASS